MKRRTKRKIDIRSKQKDYGGLILLIAPEVVIASFEYMMDESLTPHDAYISKLGMHVLFLVYKFWAD